MKEKKKESIQVKASICEEGNGGGEEREGIGREGEKEVDRAAERGER